MYHNMRPQRFEDKGIMTSRVDSLDLKVAEADCVVYSAWGLHQFLNYE